MERETFPRRLTDDERAMLELVRSWSDAVRAYRCSPPSFSAARVTLEGYEPVTVVIARGEHAVDLEEFVACAWSARLSEYPKRGAPLDS